ncbi:hypothetical protein GCM10010520_33970 [Rhizobium viscosum]|uniref:ABC-type nitrate/sulfonate/bicarbonate transport system ATPase subunit n=1 Tax=Rhizobium viscosum TaxID=1673 RepID=A0ABR9IRH2_RHIVS|nr:ABC-type nitrate/sulfonate/bicarbonate transport system ATPase subunit [Rhizobium viscosum]
MGRLNPNFKRFKEPIKALSGGQGQSVAIARAILFNARILIMDEPTAALGPQETAQVGELIKQLKKEGIGIFLISHDVFHLADRAPQGHPRPRRHASLIGRYARQANSAARKDRRSFHFGNSVQPKSH